MSYLQDENPYTYNDNLGTILGLGAGPGRYMLIYLFRNQDSIGWFMYIFLHGIAEYCIIVSYWS